MRRTRIALPLAILARFACGQVASMPLDPQTATSPSGHYALWENPTKPSGAGEAFYRLKKDGKTVWARNIAFSMERFGVTDDGTVGGYAYSEGIQTPGKLIVAILNPNGTSHLYEAHPRGMTALPNHGPEPSVEHFFVDGANDRMVIVPSDPFPERGRVLWWTYRLSTGKPVAVRALFAPNRSFRVLRETRPVPGTPLTLLEWRKSNANDAMISLVDMDGNDLWHLSTPVTAPNEVPPSTSGGSLIASAAGAGRFTIQSAKGDTVTEYRATQIGGNWTVTEESPPQKIVSRPVTRRVATLNLEAAGKFELPLKTQNESSIREIDDFEILPDDRFAILRGGDSPALIETDPAGKVTGLVPLSFGARAGGEKRLLARLKDGKFVIFVTSPGVGRRARAWIADPSRGQIEAIPRSQSLPVKAVAADLTGGYVVLAEDSRPPSPPYQTLSAYDRRGMLRWTHAASAAYGANPGDLFAPEDVTVDASGNIVVLDVIAHTLQFFDPQGVFLRRIELDKVWAKKAGYPANLSATKDGGFLLYDLQGSKSILRLNPNGSIRVSLNAVADDGTRLSLTTAPRLDARGHVWVTDSVQIYRLGAHGAVAETLGAAPESNGIEKLADVALDAAGNVYGLDALSGDLHAFDHGGHERFVGQPLPSEVGKRPIDGKVTVTRSGDIYVSFDRWGLFLAHFTPTGDRVFPAPTEASGAPPKWRWEGTELLDDQGHKRVRLDRWPNLDWLGPNVTAVAPNGALAVFSPPGAESAHPYRLAFYAPDGTPLGMGMVPSTVRGISAPAYDGKWVYFARKNDIVAFNHSGDPVWRFALPAYLRGFCRVLVWTGGIGLYDGQRSIYWYRVP